MAIKNSATVYINGRNLTHYTVLPLKWGNLLDERLDEMYLSLRRCPIETFKPLTPVEIHYSNTLSFGGETVDTQTNVIRYIVANDSGAVESPVGSGRWNHDLYIIELTKYLECIVVDTNTITNTLGRVYVEDPEPEPQTPQVDITTDVGNATIVFQDAFFMPQTPPFYVSHIVTGQQFAFLSPTKIFQSFWEQWGNYAYAGYPFSPAYEPYLRITVRKDGYSIYTQYWSYNPQIQKPYGKEEIVKDFTITAEGGTYTVEYRCELNSYSVSGTAGGINYALNGRKYSLTEYAFAAENAVDEEKKNIYPLKRWTMTDVINRLFDIAEPLRKGESPRFSLNAAQAAMFEKILAPQFSFTKSTLRECLQECGKVIHGEPRLDVKDMGAGGFYFEVSFDLYGQEERSHIADRRYIAKTVSQVIDSYATYLDSNAENLVNQLDKYAGVIVEPYAGGFKTVRTETMYARITDANMIIQTQYPIYTVSKIECGIIPQNKSAGDLFDITAYIFENSIYNTRLSSYSDAYPESKAYGIYYTQGQKNIGGLNFKQEHPMSPVFEKYAIINILERVTNKTITIDSALEGGDKDDFKYKTGNYPLLAFRVTYTPIYNSRVSQTKTNYLDYPYGAALVFNQQANIVEARYFGENLKGTIARIGNVEKSYTYNLTRLDQIPKTGQMFDADYFISAVSVEFLTSSIKCTIGLSKDFNRLSRYIGISSVKRFSEVSETQALERNTLWKEYIVIGDDITPDSDTYIQMNLMSDVRGIFDQSSLNSRVTNVVAWGGTYDQPNYTEDTITIPEDDVDIQFSNTTYLITVTLKKEYDGRKFVLLNMQYSAPNHPGEENNLSLRFSGQSITVDARDYAPLADDKITIQSLTFIRAETDIVNYPLLAVSLPVVTSAFGNSIAFSWAYEDNYSAGAISQYSESGEGDNLVNGYFQNNYQYTDYYGKIYYYHFRLRGSGEKPNSFDDQTEIGLRLPGDNETAVSYGPSYIGTDEAEPIILRKDNREKLQCNFQIDFVTNRKGLIIGSALAAYCPAVRGGDEALTPRLYIFDQTLDKFINHLEGGTTIDISTATSYPVSVSALSANERKFSVTADAFATSGKSWAIVTAQTEQSETVEDEEGNVTTQTVQYGGDVLLAQNMDISAGQAFTPIYFNAKRKIFKEDVWIANK